MTDNIQYIDVDSDDYLDAPKALRDHVKRIQETLKSVSQERDNYKSQATASALGDVLAGYKNPKRIQRDLLSDGIDPLDSEGVQKWLAENGDDYARGDSGNAQTVADDEAAAHQRIQSADLSNPADLTKQAAFEAEIPPNATPAQIRELAAKHGL